MSLIVRLMQSLPLVIALAILALVVYVVVSWLRSPTRAKEILIKLFTVVSIVISVLFGAASAYALFEGNQSIFELMAPFFAVGIVALAITRICRWRFVKNHPNYDSKSLPTEWL